MRIVNDLLEKKQIKSVLSQFFQISTKDLPPHQSLIGSSDKKCSYAISNILSGHLTGIALLLAELLFLRENVCQLYIEECVVEEYPSNMVQLST